MHRCLLHLCRTFPPVLRCIYSTVSPFFAEPIKIPRYIWIPYLVLDPPIHPSIPLLVSEGQNRWPSLLARKPTGRKSSASREPWNDTSIVPNETSLQGWPAPHRGSALGRLNCFMTLHCDGVIAFLRNWILTPTTRPCDKFNYDSNQRHEHDQNAPAHQGGGRLHRARYRDDLFKL